MKQIEIRYTREVMFHKIINVSDKLAKRLLDVEEESLIQRNGSWGGGEEDIFQVGKNGMTVKCNKCNITRKQKVLRQSLDWLKVKMIEDWNTRTKLTPPQE